MIQKFSRRSALTVPMASLLSAATSKSPLEDSGDRSLAVRRGPTGTLRDVGQEIADGFVAPDQFRADSETDDHAAMQRAINYSRTHNGKGIVGLGRVYRIGPSDFHDVNMLTSQGFGNTVLKALPNSRDGNGTAFIRYRNMGRCSWQSIQIDANDEFDIGFDTSWTGASGPSLNILYKMLLIRGFRRLGWLADNNNDVWNEQVVIVEPGAGAPANPRTPTVPLVTAYRNHGPGGPIGFSGCNFLCGPVEVAGQNITFDRTVVRGIRVPAGGGFNTLDITGGHLFADEATGLNFDLAGRIAGLSVRGTQIENSAPHGAIFGGTAALVPNAVTLTGVHALRSGTADGKASLCRGGLRSAGGGLVTVLWAGGQLDGIDVGELGDWAAFDAPGTCVNGSVAHTWQRRSVSRVAKTTSFGTDGAWTTQSAPRTGLTCAGLATFVITRGDRWVDVTEFPRGFGAWHVAAVADDPHAPSAVILICRNGAEAVAKVLHGAVGAEGLRNAQLEWRFDAGRWQVRMNGAATVGEITWTLNISGSAAT